LIIFDRIGIEIKPNVWKKRGKKQISDNIYKYIFFLEIWTKANNFLPKTCWKNWKSE